MKIFIFIDPPKSLSLSKSLNHIFLIKIIRSFYHVADYDRIDNFCISYIYTSFQDNFKQNIITKKKSEEEKKIIRMKFDKHHRRSKYKL